MGQSQSVLGEWASAHEMICKILSGCLLIFSLSFIIAGAALISQNAGPWDMDHETFEQATSRQSRYGGGIALVMLGVFFLFAGVISFCCSFELKFFRKAVEPRDYNRPINEQQPYPNYSSQSQPYPPMPPVPAQPPPYSE